MAKPGVQTSGFWGFLATVGTAFAACLASEDRWVKIAALDALAVVWAGVGTVYVCVGTRIMVSAGEKMVPDEEKRRTTYITTNEQRKQRHEEMLLSDLPETLRLYLPKQVKGSDAEAGQISRGRGDRTGSGRGVARGNPMAAHEIC